MRVRAREHHLRPRRQRLGVLDDLDAVGVDRHGRAVDVQKGRRLPGRRLGLDEYRAGQRQAVLEADGVDAVPAVVAADGAQKCAEIISSPNFRRSGHNHITGSMDFIGTKR